MVVDSQAEILAMKADVRNGARVLTGVIYFPTHSTGLVVCSAHRLELEREGPQYLVNN